jgi:hypothetical protein
LKRALLTINFNHALCSNSRASMEAAAERWSAKFLEIDESCNPGIRVSPAALKCFCFELSSANEFFILDADTVVSAECPNPFETFSGPELIAVANGSERFGDLCQIRSCEEYEWNKLKAEEPRLSNAFRIPGQYFNTGMMLVKRAHHKACFDLIADIVKTDHGLGWNDQTPINMAVRALGIKVRLVDEKFNYIHPMMLGGGWLKMKSTGACIYHGAGEPGRELWLPRIIWQ